MKKPWNFRDSAFETGARELSSFFGARAIVFCLMILGLVCACSPSQDTKQEKPEEPLAKVEKLDGEVLVLRLGAKEMVHLHLGDPLFGGDVLSTEGGGAVEIRVGENSTLSVASGSIVKINPVLDRAVDSPSMFLQRGRVFLRAQPGSQSPAVVLESFHMSVLSLSGELQAAVAEDLGVLLCVPQGESRVEGVGFKIPLGTKQETEADFLERPGPPRQYKERSEADWAGWMAARFRNLPLRMLELAAKMNRCLKETAVERLEVRTQIDRRNLEIESLARSLSEEDQGPLGDREAVLKKLKALAMLQAESLVRLRHLGTRTELLLPELERLKRRSQGMKKELGESYSPLEQLLTSLMDGGKPLAAALQEERSYLAVHCQQWRWAVGAAGGLHPVLQDKPAAEPARASLEEKKAPAKPPAQEKPKSKSISNSAGSKPSSTGSSGKSKSSQKEQAKPSQTKPKTQQKSSAGTKASSGSSSAKKAKSSGTQKEKRTDSKQSSP